MAKPGLNLSTLGTINIILPEITSTNELFVIGQDQVISPTPPNYFDRKNNFEDSNLLSGPGKIAIPILLYHHITEANVSNSYSVSKANFKNQLEYLSLNGYQTISINSLVKAIMVGAELPRKPVILTFDDGNQNVYQNAFSLMKDKGFFGMVLIIASRINAEGFLSVQQLMELSSAGWEIGSHGMRHVDLVKEPQVLRDEIGNSKKFIENALHLHVSVFAYPYGKADHVTMDWVKQIGYTSALGLGISNNHNQGNLFYLERREIKNEMSLDDFAKVLELE